MDQLEPGNQVAAVLPVEPSLEQGLTADGKRQLHLFSRWFQVASAERIQQGKWITLETFNPPQLT